MEQAKQRADDATPSADDAEEGMSRLALLGHGVYYLLLALLVSQLLTGGGNGQQTDAQGAIATVASQPFGQFLLAGLTAAFIAYALRRWKLLVQKDDTKKQLKNAGSAIVWTFLSFLAASTLLDGLGVTGGSGSGGQSGPGITQSILGMPGGQFLVGLIGVGIVGVAAYYGKRASDRALGNELGELGIDGKRVATVLGRVGYAGRSLAYGLVGLFVIRAAMNHDPDAGKGLDGALRTVQQASWGTWVLLAVTIGFAAFGAFRLLEARYARNPED